ncbi:hypothetical protein KFE25_000487 [Diacronema lutheri]|uniref:3'-5' exonuclease domain-containing protein n=1 Tax=Diacronema lutheri TaxID=2081491 RepID=A0A8J5XEB7_DIALT|nr:hypothetical protein KFE25_000487 [Diacronema lutheri]
MTPLGDLRHKVVRDLCWVLGSAHLLGAQAGAPLLDDGWCQTIVARSAAWLRDLDAEPEPLLAFVRAQRGRARLGHYVAALLEYWLHASPELRASRLITGARLEAEGGADLGQLKYLFTTDAEAGIGGAPRVVTHWELHVKFFLYMPPEPVCAALGAPRAAQLVTPDSAARAEDALLDRFVGPFVGETLLDRTRILSHRLTMGRARALHHWLGDQLGARVDVRSAGVLRGTLFYPLGDAELAPAHAAAAGIVGARHARGWYCDDLALALDSFAGCKWALPRGEGSGKLHWLAPSRARAAERGGPLQIAGVESLGIGAVDVLDRAEMAPIAAAALARDGGTPVLLLALRRARPMGTEGTVGAAAEDTAEATDAVMADEWIECSRGFVLPAEWDPTPLWQRPPPGAPAPAPAPTDGAPPAALPAAASSRASAARRYHGKAMAAVSCERVDSSAAARVVSVRLCGEPCAASRLGPSQGLSHVDSGQPAPHGGAHAADGSRAAEPIGAEDVLACLGLLVPALADAPSSAPDALGGTSCAGGARHAQRGLSADDGHAGRGPRARAHARESSARLNALVLATDRPVLLLLDALLTLDVRCSDAQRQGAAGAARAHAPGGAQARRGAAHVLVDALRSVSRHATARRARTAASPPEQPLPPQTVYTGGVTCAHAAVTRLLERLVRGSGALCPRAVVRAVDAVGLALPADGALAARLLALLDARARAHGRISAATPPACADEGLAARVGAPQLCALAVKCALPLGPGVPLGPLVDAIVADASTGADGADSARCARALLAHARAHVEPVAGTDAESCELQLQRVRAHDGRSWSLSPEASLALARTRVAPHNKVATRAPRAQGEARPPSPRATRSPPPHATPFALPAGCRVTLVDTPTALHLLAAALDACVEAGDGLLGLDVEWRPDGSSSSRTVGRAVAVAVAIAERACAAPAAAECAPAASCARGEHTLNPPALLQIAIGRRAPAVRARAAGALCGVLDDVVGGASAQSVWLLDLLVVERALRDVVDEGGAELALAARRAEASVRRALHSARCTKLGFAFGEDLDRLHYGLRYMRCFDRAAPMCDLRAAAALAAQGGPASKSASDGGITGRSNGGRSLAATLARACGFSLDKAEQTSDWARRPLSVSQLHYAACDAACLVPLHAALSASAPRAVCAATCDARPSAQRGRLRLRAPDASAAPCGAALELVRAAIRHARAGSALIEAAPSWPSAPASLAANATVIEANAICVVAPAANCDAPHEQLLLVVTAAGTRLDLRTLARHVRASRLRLAMLDECEALFGAVAGFVPPVPLAPAVRVLLHPSAARARWLCASAGDVGVRLRVEARSLEAITGGRWLPSEEGPHRSRADSDGTALPSREDQSAGP